MSPDALDTDILVLVLQLQKTQNSLRIVEHQIIRVFQMISHGTSGYKNIASLQTH